NTQLMFRDFLLIAQMETSIKSRDFGHVEKLLGLFTIWFCGVGARNYVQESLNSLYNLYVVWPEGYWYV
ncbi:hypothetical protein OF83DRAFT_1020455, partial [Amylostereum chailletii]